MTNINELPKSRLYTAMVFRLSFLKVSSQQSRASHNLTAHTLVLYVYGPRYKQDQELSQEILREEKKMTSK